MFYLIFSCFHHLFIVVNLNLIFLEFGTDWRNLLWRYARVWLPIALDFVLSQNVLMASTV